MYRIKIISQIIGVIILLNLFACDLLKGVLEKNGTELLDSIKNNYQEELSFDLAALSTKVKAQLIENISLKSEADLSDYYTPIYIDSLRTVLIETGNLKINVFESFLLKHLKSKAIKDTLYLTNLNLNSPTKGEVKSYEFDVKKDDVIFYEIINIKKNTLKEINILEGGKTRYVKNNLKKKESARGAIKIAADNVLTVNISNDNFIKNMGFFKSKLKIVIKKTAPQLKLQVEIKPDTIVSSRPFIEEVNDTIYKIIDSKNFTLGPRLDLTRNYKQTFDINIDEFDNLLGWGYWIGLDKVSIEQYTVLSESENPLIVFSKNELIKALRPVELSVNLNKEVELVIKNQSLDARSYNYASNFAFYKSDDFIEKKIKKAEVYLTNTSTLYEYDVSYNVVAVGTIKIKNETMKDIIAFKDYIHITIIKDE
ncbi:MAG: hypothetical protein ACJAYY_001540 [Paraglaciecola sp.]|jgi:hypothetical protein